MLRGELVAQRPARLRVPAAFDREIFDLAAQRIDLERLADLEEDRRDALDRPVAVVRDLDDVE